MFENKDGIMVKFHDKTWENLITLSKAGGSTRLMLMQLNALNKEKVQLENKVAGITKEMLKIVGKIELLQDLAEKEIKKKEAK